MNPLPGGKQTRRIKRPVHGVLLLNKPVGLTSNAALQTAKRLLQAEKAGHTGTLDPFAEGLLPLCLGEASKFASWQLEADKVYRATLYLGVTTTTGDLEGEMLTHAPVQVNESVLRRVLTEFLGTIQQLPPMYSALKVDGKPLYVYARAGITIERKLRQVHIRCIELLRFTSPLVEIDVTCSAGTYIRTLAEDIGARLGCGAHLTQLKRLSSGGYLVNEAVTLEMLQHADVSQQMGFIRPMDSLVAHLPRVNVDRDVAQALVRGQHPYCLQPTQIGVVRVFCAERFVGLVEWGDTGMMIPKRLISAHLCLE